MRDNRVLAVLVLVALLLAGHIAVSLLRWQDDKDVSYETTSLTVFDEKDRAELARYGRNGWHIVSTRWAREGMQLDIERDRWGYEMILERRAP